MTKYIQISGWNNFSPSKQKQVNKWIKQILNAKLAAQSLLELMSQTSSSDSSATEFVQALKNTIDNDFEVADIIMEEDSIRGDSQISRTNLDTISKLEFKEARPGTEDLCDMVEILVCGQNNTDCHKEVRRICPGNSSLETN